MSQTQHVLVPTDFSDISIEAIQTASELAFASTEVTVLHVYDPSNLTGPATRDICPPGRGLPSDIERRVMENLRRISHGRLKNTIKTNLEYMISRYPAESICEYARDNMVDLIVLTTHGRTGLSHLFMGSVAEKVVRKATCPVLIARTRTKQKLTKERFIEPIDKDVA